MFTIFRLLFSFFRASLRSRATLQAENLALRHQLLVLQRSTRDRRLRLRVAARLVWVWLSRLWIALRYFDSRFCWRQVQWPCAAPAPGLSSGPEHSAGAGRRSRTISM